MRHFAIGLLAFLWIDHAMAQEHLRISSDWGSITAELADNDAARAVIKMLPIAIDMRDHLRQEKTGNLPIAVAGDSPATRFCSRHAWALGARSLCYLLHQGPCAAARNCHSWHRDRRYHDL